MLSLAQSSVGKTFSKTFNTEDKGTIKLDLPGNVDLKIWNNPTIRVEIGISLANGNNSMVNELANVGRYNISSLAEGDVLHILMPNIQKQIKVKGEVLRENLTYTVFAPKDLKIIVPNVATLADVK
ncbi:MAG: hypothetical protein JNM22_01515 [Saprospiraceae bacterium]|nr:hypothetical protein [Saprospiraceae bacterium]